MLNFFFRLRRLPWLLGQRLTKEPLNEKSTISDLFFWRYDNEWDTYIELLDIAGLFGLDNDNKVLLIFFDKNGNRFLEKHIDITLKNRQTIPVSKLISEAVNYDGKYGTFCVFHKSIPSIVSESNSFITERGYVSYKNSKSPLRSYVHGNLDAIDNSLKPLGGSSFLYRKFNLQYFLDIGSNYEFVLINVTSSEKKVIYSFIDPNGNVLIEDSLLLGPLHSHLITTKNFKVPVRLIIKSKMIMARPIVFKLMPTSFDVFHG